MTYDEWEGRALPAMCVARCNVRQLRHHILSRPRRPDAGEETSCTLHMTIKRSQGAPALQPASKNAKSTQDHQTELCRLMTAGIEQHPTSRWAERRKGKF